ncbi:MAG: RNase H family protein [Propioniciclava sp.]
MIVAAADGSSLSNPGPAGWAWFIDADHWRSGGWNHGTNNMGELMAVLDLLEQTAAAEDDLLIYCDSQYVINAVTKWMPGWKRKGWKKADGNPVLNVDLLKGIDAALVDRRVSFEWVKGHNGHDLNEAADARARAAADAFRRGVTVAEGPGFAGATTTGTRQVTPGPTPEPDLLSVAAVPEEHPAVALQRELFTADLRGDRDAFAQHLHPGFGEHDRRGRARGKGRLLATLSPLAEPVRLDIDGVDDLAPWAVLLRWRLRTGETSVLGSSVWVRNGDAWRLRFLQETPTAR